MAKVGMEYVVSAHLTEGENGAATYTKGRYWGPASSFSVSPNASSVDDYGDDGIVESDRSVTNAGVSIELNESTLELEADILGHEYSSETKEMTASRDDIAPWLGMGCVGKSMRNNKLVYRVIWLAKVMVNEVGEELATKQETTTFNHSSYEATAYALNDEKGTWVIKKEFDTLADAKSYLNEKAGISA